MGGPAARRPAGASPVTRQRAGWHVWRPPPPASPSPTVFSLHTRRLARCQLESGPRRSPSTGGWRSVPQRRACRTGRWRSARSPAPRPLGWGGRERERESRTGDGPVSYPRPGGQPPHPTRPRPPWLWYKATRPLLSLGGTGSFRGRWHRGKVGLPPRAASSPCCGRRSARYSGEHRHSGRVGLFQTRVPDSTARPAPARALSAPGSVARVTAPSIGRRPPSAERPWSPDPPGLPGAEEDLVPALAAESSPRPHGGRADAVSLARHLGQLFKAEHATRCLRFRLSEENGGSRTPSWQQRWPATPPCSRPQAAGGHPSRRPDRFSSAQEAPAPAAHCAPCSDRGQICPRPRAPAGGGKTQTDRGPLPRLPGLEHGRCSGVSAE